MTGNMTLSITALILLLAGCAKEAPSLDFQVSETSLGYEGGVVTMNISSNNPWKLSCDDWWLETPVAAGEKGKSEITAVARENKSAQGRSVKVTISSGGLVKTAEIVQAAAPETPGTPSGPDTPAGPDNPDPPVTPDEFTEYKRSGFKKMQILGFWGPGAEDRTKTLTAEKYREMAQCGFTISLVKMFSVDNIKKFAAAAEGTGVQLIIGLSDVTEANIGLVKDIPQIYGWYVRDEPKVADMPAVKEKCDLYNKVDPSRMCYVNLLPIHASRTFSGVDSYYDYMQAYLDTGIPFLSYDFYSISGEDMDLHPRYYEALDYVAGIGRNKGYPVWTFVLSYDHGKYYTVNTATMRFQAWAGIAYGSECIEYYTYQTPLDAKYGTGLLDTNYLTNDKWEAAKDLNSEMQGLADVLVGRELIKVRGIGYNTVGLSALEDGDLPAPFTQIRCGLPDGVLMSHFKNGEAEFVMLLNLSYKLSQSIEIEYTDGAQLKEFVVDRQYISQFKTRQAAKKRVLAPGDIALYQIK